MLINRFAILPRDLTIESGELTPTLKVKRRIVDEHFKLLIDGMYKGTGG
jgi:long-chain acyl-CoA synthetase